MVVAYPQLPDDVNTYRIALLNNGVQRDYFAGMRWADFLPDSIQSALIATLKKSHSFDDVVSDGQASRIRWRLDTHVARFEAVYGNTEEAPRVTTEIKFTWMDTHTGKRVRSFTVSQEKTAASNTKKAISEAFQQAFLALQEDAMNRLLSCAGNR